MTDPRSVRLLEVEPDLASLLSEEDRELAAQVAFPVQTARAGALDLHELLGEPGSFGAVVLQGMLLHRVVIGEQAALRLLGPGDIVSFGHEPVPAIVEDCGYHAAGPTHLALLEDHALVVMRRFPQLAIRLQLRLADQQERMAAQLVICQLPRVEDRVLAMMWLLAETWGRVTAAGTTLPLALTHEALGELVGAKRPTVSLALRDLGERGALARLDRGWLLLEPPKRGNGGPPPGRHPEVITEGVSGWEPEPELESELGSNLSLRQTVEEFRASHRHLSARLAARAELAHAVRERSRQLRERVRESRVTRQPPS